MKELTLVFLSRKNKGDFHQFLQKSVWQSRNVCPYTYPKGGRNTAKVVQAIENLFPSTADQKHAFDYVLELKKRGRTFHNPEILLELLSYSKGKIENLLDVNSPMMGEYHFMVEEIAPIFPNMKAAEEWVKSITKPPV